MCIAHCATHVFLCSEPLNTIPFSICLSAHRTVWIFSIYFHNAIGKKMVRLRLQCKLYIVSIPSNIKAFNGAQLKCIVFQTNIDFKSKAAPFFLSFSLNFLVRSYNCTRTLYLQSYLLCWLTRFFFAFFFSNCSSWHLSRSISKQSTKKNLIENSKRIFVRVSVVGWIFRGFAHRQAFSYKIQPFCWFNFLFNSLCLC